MCVSSPDLRQRTSLGGEIGLSGRLKAAIPSALPYTAVHFPSTCPAHLKSQPTDRVRWATSFNLSIGEAEVDQSL